MTGLPAPSKPVRVVLAAVVLAWAASLAQTSSAGAETGAPVSGPLHRAGTWMVDDQSRVVVEHGFNVIKKVAPFVRTQFGEADARLLADEGFTAARIGFIWAGVEPQPGVYDDAYIRRVLALDDLLARYGIRTLVDFHQDEWSQSTGGDGAPKWATLGASADDSFAAFWRDQKGPDGIGIQTRFILAWEHVARLLAGHRNVLALDPFNEPYPGSDYPPPCGDFFPCPSFESGALAAFYRRVIGAIRAGGARQTIDPEGVADSGVMPPALPRFDDPQTAYTFHFYCNLTQLDPREVSLGEPSPEASACAPIEQRDIGNFLDYAKGLGVPALLGEFSCNDVNPDNAQVVDQVHAAFTSWTIWAYYTAADDPADCPAQGLLVSDSQPGSEANAKQPKLDALAVPYAQAIAGTPKATGFDRSTHTFTLDYDTAPVPGATLAPGALTQVFIPARQYPTGYRVQVTGARVVSEARAPWLLVAAEPGAGSVSVRVTPDAGGSTQRPLQTGVLPLASSAVAPAPSPGGACPGPRTVFLRLPRRAHLLSVRVSGRRVRVRPHHRRVRLVLRRSARVRLVLRTAAGRRVVRVISYRLCRSGSRHRRSRRG